MSRRHSTSVQPDPLRKELLSISDRLALVQATATPAEFALANQKAEVVKTPKCPWCCVATGQMP